LRAKRAVVASLQERDASRGSPRSFVAQKRLAQDDNRLVRQNFGKDSAVDVPAGDHQADALAPQSLVFFQSCG
jgi:hypothetical protein